MILIAFPLIPTGPSFLVLHRLPRLNPGADGTNLLV